MSDTVAKYIRDEEAVAAWRDRINTGQVDRMFVAGDGELARYAIGPGRVTLQGGAPGQGKTALIMQLTIDALRLNPGLRACVCNVEMTVNALLDRQLARISGIDLNTIRSRTIEGDNADRVDVAISTLEGVADRLSFVKPPFSLTNVAETADAERSELLVLDYIQRITPPGDHRDKRGSVDAMMNHLREFADHGMAVVVVAAVSRTKDKKGRSSYDAAGLGLASFRESSELEFGADDAYMLVSGKEDGTALLKHLKARHDEMRDIELEFDGSLQRFTAADVSSAVADAAGQEALRAAWAAAGKRGVNP